MHLLVNCWTAWTHVGAGFCGLYQRLTKARIKKYTNTQIKYLVPF